MPIPSGFEHIVHENEPLAASHVVWARRAGASISRSRRASMSWRPWSAAATRPDCRSACWAADRSAGARRRGRGLVVALGAAAFGRIDVTGRRVVAGGGAKLGHVISTAVRESLAGLEMLVGNSRHRRRGAAYQRWHAWRRHRSNGGIGHGHDAQGRAGDATKE